MTSFIFHQSPDSNLLCLFLTMNFKSKEQKSKKHKSHFIWCCRRVCSECSELWGLDMSVPYFYCRKWFVHCHVHSVNAIWLCYKLQTLNMWTFYIEFITLFVTRCGDDTDIVKSIDKSISTIQQNCALKIYWWFLFLPNYFACRKRKIMDESRTQIHTHSDIKRHYINSFTW